MYNYSFYIHYVQNYIQDVNVTYRKIIIEKYKHSMSIQLAYFKSVPLFYMFTQYLTTDRSIQVEGIK